MRARINQPAMVIPAAMKALMALGESAKESGVPARTLDLVHLRTSQINGCSGCLFMHAKASKQNGESDEREFFVAAWRDTTFFTDAERAALALTEAVTRVADRADPVPDHVWDEAAAHYDESQLSALLIAIATTNVWNRLNVATRQIVGPQT